MRKTTVMIDEELIERAMNATHLHTKREVIEEGLRELVRRHERELLRADLGTFNLDLTLQKLERDRQDG